MLQDCISKTEAELLLLSPGFALDTARIHRDRFLQALLPVTDELFSAKDASFDIALDNEECKMLIACLGVGVWLEELGIEQDSASFDLGRLRYQKVIVALADEGETPN